MAKDAKVRAKARALYEAGQSFSEIADRLPASVRTMKMWCKKEGWVKGESAPELHRKEQIALERAAEQSGLTKALVAETAVKLMKAQDVLMIGPEGQIFKHALPAHAVMKKDSAGRLVAPVLGVDYEVVEDRKAMNDGAKLGASILQMSKQNDAPDLAGSILAWVRSQA